MMVGVPVLLMVCVSAFVPFVWVMAVGVGVFGVWWCCFQWCVAVVWVSRRVPGVSGCSGESGLVWACSGVFLLVSGVGCAKAGVGWLVLAGVVGASVGVSWLVCVVWFRMLTCFGLFPVSWFCLLVCLVNNAAWAGWVGLACACEGVVWLCWWFGGVRGVCLVWGAALGSCGRVFGVVWLLGCCLLFVWCVLLCVSVFVERGAG